MIGCVICGGEELVRTTLGGLQRVYCTACFHGARVDIPSFDYTCNAMGSSLERSAILDQAAFLTARIQPAARVLELGCALLWRRP